MPVMDGLTATRTIRALDRQDAKTIPIIAMTANAFREDAERCMEAGMNAHLAKPLDDKTIKQTICEELRSSRDCFCILPFQGSYCFCGSKPIHHRHHDIH